MKTVIKHIIMLWLAGLGFSLSSAVLAEAEHQHHHEHHHHDPASATKAEVVTDAELLQQMGGDFTLTNQAGESFELKQLRGQVVLLFFGYTHCPHICPATLTQLQRVQQALGEQAEQVSMLLVTVDPERDTVARMQTYLSSFTDAVIGLTGTPDEVQAVTKAYQAQVKLRRDSPSDKDYLVDHSTQLYVIDPAGELDSLIPFGMPAEHITQTVQAILARQEDVAKAQPMTSEPEQTSTAKPALDAPQALQKTLALPVLQAAEGAATADNKPASTAGKPVLINFWATWCPPCREELPALNRAWAALKADGVAMLAVNVGEEKAAIKRFLQDYPIDFTVLYDLPGDSMAQWQLQNLPSTLILDRDGEIAYRVVGEKAWDDPEIVQQIRDLAQP